MVRCQAGNCECRSSRGLSPAPRIVIGGGMHQLPPGLGRQLGRLGWQLHETMDASSARQIARQIQPEVVVLSTDSEGESAMLTCAKLRHELPGTRIVMVGPDDEALQRFARFAGATGYLDDSVPAESVIASLHHELSIAC